MRDEISVVKHRRQLCPPGRGEETVGKALGRGCGAG